MWLAVRPARYGTLKDKYRSRRDELIESLQQDQIAFLRNELAARNEELHRREKYQEESHRKGHLIMALPELPVPSEASHGPEIVTPGSGRVNCPSGRSWVLQTGARRPWWRRMFD